MSAKYVSAILSTALEWTKRLAAPVAHPFAAGRKSVGIDVRARRANHQQTADARLLHGGHGNFGKQHVVFDKKILRQPP